MSEKREAVWLTSSERSDAYAALLTVAALFEGQGRRPDADRLREAADRLLLQPEDDAA